MSKLYNTDDRDSESVILTMVIFPQNSIRRKEIVTLDLEMYLK